MQRKYKAAVYLRISNSDEKNGESESLSNQRILIDDYLKKYPDIEVVTEKIDDGYTGLLFDRPVFKEMMEDIFAEKVDCVVVKDDCVIIGLNRKNPVNIRVCGLKGLDLSFLT